jgi:hypothetical protein
MMEVRKISADEGWAWDELIRSSRQGNIFLSHEFQTAWCEADPALHLLRLGCYDEQGKLIGGQPIFYKKAFGLRIPLVLNIFYGNTPVLSSSVQDDCLQQHAVLSALARESRRHFPLLKVEFHPTLKDARPYLEQDWHAEPEYTHVWEINDPDAILMNLQHRKRQYVRKAREQFLFTYETNDAVVTEFFRLYRETMQKFDWRPEERWGKNLRKRIEWMRARDMVRLYTCRMKTGELIGAVMCVLSRSNRTVYSMYIAYDHSIQSKDFLPALDWYTAQDLSQEFSYVDLSEAPQPTLYGYKDSLGASSTQYWILETRNARRWRNFYDALRKLKRAITNHLP